MKDPAARVRPRSHREGPVDSKGSLERDHVSLQSCRPKQTDQEENRRLLKVDGESGRFKTRVGFKGPDVRGVLSE